MIELYTLVLDIRRLISDVIFSDQTLQLMQALLQKCIQIYVQSTRTLRQSSVKSTYFDDDTGLKTVQLYFSHLIKQIIKFSTVKYVRVLFLHSENTSFIQLRHQ